MKINSLAGPLSSIGPHKQIKYSANSNSLAFPVFLMFLAKLDRQSSHYQSVDQH